MTTQEWSKRRKAAYEKEALLRDRRDRKKVLNRKPPTKSQIQTISKLRVVSDFEVEQYPSNRVEADALIRSLRAAPPKF